MPVRSSSKDSVHFRDFLCDFLPVAFSHTPRNDQRFQAAGLLILCHLKDRFNALLHGIMDKTTSIHNNDIRILLGVHNLISSGGKKSQHGLRVGKIFVTPQ